MNSRHNNTERLGVNAIERIVIEDLKWIFREQPLVDVGIDAIIEVVQNDNPLGKFIAIQIKTGKSQFHSNKKNYVYYASDIHYNYWTNCNLPVILIGYFPEDLEAYWIPLMPENFIRTKKQWKIDIPKKQKFSVISESRLLNLVNMSITSAIDFDWTIEKVQKLKFKAQNLSKSNQYIINFVEHLNIIQDAQEKANIKLSELVILGVDIKSYQTKLVFKELKSSMDSVTPIIERDINNFSELFGLGMQAVNEFVQGCKQLNLDYVLEDILHKFRTIPIAVKDAVIKIEGLKISVDKFPKHDISLKQSMVRLSEVLSLVTREFRVASELTENIIEFIEN